MQRQSDGPQEPAELLRAAGATLRRSRAMGMRQWAAFHAGIDAADRAELRLAATLPGALETGELQVEYQTGVGCAVGQWLLRTAAEQAAPLG